MASRLFRGGCVLAPVLVAAVAALDAQAPRTLTIDAIYHPERRVDFDGARAPAIRWVDADAYARPRRGSGGAEWVKVDAITGQETPLFDADRMERAVASLPGIEREDAARVARSSDLTFNPDWSGALFALDDDLYFYEFATGKAGRLTDAPGEEEIPAFSPNGRSVAFVRANNLFAVNVGTRKERQLTRDGNADILNGKLDWLYQEEIFGRGQFRGYWWSPDSSSLAFLQLDERPVPTYTIVDDIPYHPIVERIRYPKAGDPNPIVKLGWVRAASGGPSFADLGAYAGTDILIMSVGWSPDSREIVSQAQNREQTWLDLNFTETRSGRTRSVLRETSPAWVDYHSGTNPIWLKDGSFLWFSGRDGFKHLYRYRADGAESGRITTGQWDVRSFEGVDEARGHVFFTAGARRHIDTDIYRVGLDGGALTRLSSTDGTHRPQFNPAQTLYVDVWSDASTPPQVRIHRADGGEVRVLEPNAVRVLREYDLPAPEFIEVPARDGFVMDAMMIKPRGFDPSRRYPVYQFTYGGPYNPAVRNEWGGTQGMFHHLLAQHGVIVWILDNRSAGGRGVRSQWPIYGRLGEVELEDLEDGVAWLRRQPYVDASRMVLSGWSYGGFMTAYALTHSTSWAAGIAGGPVTDWRDYDTVYTERYMKTPANNPEGYKRTAPRFAADRLTGELMLVHGAIDDNVHPQNTKQLAYELQRAGKKFSLMLYPKSRHGITDARLNTHLRQLMFDFVERTVLARPRATGGSTP